MEVADLSSVHAARRYSFKEAVAIVCEIPRFDRTFETDAQKFENCGFSENLNNNVGYGP